MISLSHGLLNGCKLYDDGGEFALQMTAGENPTVTREYSVKLSLMRVDDLFTS